ncbi:MAG: phosphomannomutase/phosphoglucomutase [Acidobacteria bacterium]|nr:phosphomannomutase/phosphoglucomutase [Acidobacteriota bacterium]
MARRLSAAEAALFKAYDVRGAAPAPLSPGLAWRVGRAFATWLGGGRIGIARDARLTSPALAGAFAAGLEGPDVEILDYGMLPTDAMWVAVRHDRLDGGAVITASHNPPGDNGIKLVERDAAPVFEENGLPKVRRLAQEVPDPPEDPPAAPETGAPRAIAADYRAFLMSVVDFRSLPALRVVLDAGNGMGGLMAGEVFPAVPGEFVAVQFRPDGAFPNRGANPLDPRNRQPLVRRVLEEGADFGVLWDGDADRCVFVDDQGRHVPGDFATALLAPAEIAKEPGTPIVFDLRSSRAVPDEVTRAGGRPRAGRVGHAYLKRRMRQEDARFGGELSGHFFFRAAGYADNALLPILLMIERIRDSGRPLSELAGDLRRRYFTVDEESRVVPDPAAAFRLVRESFPGGNVSTLDGLTIDFPDWRFTLRPSNTEPVMRLTLEAYREGLAETRRDELLTLLERGNLTR